MTMKWRWYIYIVDEGDWPINYFGPDPAHARKAYLQWARRKTMPKGSVIWETGA